MISKSTIKVLNLLAKKKSQKNHINGYADFQKLRFSQRNDYYNKKLDNKFYFLKKHRPDENNNEPILPISKEEFKEFSNLEKKKFIFSGVKKGDNCSIIDFSLSELIPMFYGLVDLGCNFLVVEGSIEMIVNDINSKNVDVIFTNPRKLNLIIDYCKINDLKLNLKKVITAGEPIADKHFLKEQVKSILNAELIDTIGTRELAVYGISCKENLDDYHLLDDDMFFEVLSNDKSDLFGFGELVVTPFWRKENPLLRWRTGDLVSIQKKKCNCVYGSKIIKGGILGRVDDSRKIGSMIYSSEIIIDVAEEAIFSQYPIIDTLIWDIFGKLDIFIYIQKNNNQDEIVILIDKVKSLLTLRRESIIKKALNNSGSTKVSIKKVNKDFILRLKKIVRNNFIDSRYVSKKIEKKLNQILKDAK